MASYRWMSLCSIVGITGIVLAVLAFRKTNFPLRPVAQLGGMLLGLVGLVGGLMILWDLSRTPTVIVTTEYLLLGNDTLQLVDIERVYIEPVSKAKATGQQEIRDLGIVQLKNGETLLFAQDNYRVKKLIGAIREVMPAR